MPRPQPQPPPLLLRVLRVLCEVSVLPLSCSLPAMRPTTLPAFGICGAGAASAAVAAAAAAACRGTPPEKKLGRASFARRMQGCNREAGDDAKPRKAGDG